MKINPTEIFLISIGCVLIISLFSVQFFYKPFSNQPTLGSIFPTSTSNPSLVSYALPLVLLNQNSGSSPLAINFPSAINISSIYVGSVIQNASLITPHAMKDAGLYKMWWCGLIPDLNVSSTTYMSIYYLTSSDGITWSNPKYVLNTSKKTFDFSGVCRPNVVNANGIYYMFYEGIAVNISNLNASGGYIFVANSTDGINWSKYPSDINPQPILRPQPNAFAEARPLSVLYLNNTFYLYYANAILLTGVNATNVYLATSSDGINFAIQNSGQPVFQSQSTASADVKYVPSLGVFIMTYDVESSLSSSHIYWTYSTDGINWASADATKTFQTQKDCNLEPTFIGYPNGTSDQQSSVYYLASDNTGTALGCANISGVSIDLSYINVAQSNINQTFSAANFSCKAVTNGYNCGIDSTNNLNESAIVTFLFIDSDGNILSNAIPIANQDTYHVAAIYSCNSPGKIYVSWKAYRLSDASLTNPIAWSKSTEQQFIAC